MNLIEQLGGYENSRGLLNLYEYSISFKYYKEFDGDFESAGHVDVFIPDLKDALLKYRRQHNIYEVGDKVVLKRPDQFSEIYTYDAYSEKMDLHFFESESDYGHVALGRVRHATDEEIKAGKRLEVNDGNRN